MIKTAIALGGNLGNTAATFELAIRKLAAAGLQNLRCSRLYRTRPVDCPPGTPDFQNAALTADFSGSAEELLEICQRLEREAGRPAEHGHNQSRPLDLDIILFGDEMRNSPRLTLPHPRAAARRFVLEPLAEIAPELRLPGTGRSVAELLAALPDSPDAR